MRRRFLIIPFAVCTVVGCSLALHFDDYSKNVDCHPAKPPPQQNAGTPGKILPAMTVAFSYMTIEGLDKNGKYEAIGYDIDNACTTCPTGLPPTCKTAAGQKLECGDNADPKSGRDNALRQVLKDVAPIYPVGDSTFNQALQSGYFTHLIQVQNWDGSPNAAGVGVNFYNGLALDGSSGPAKLNGTDVWIVESDNNPAPGIPLYQALNSYVVNGTLVANFTNKTGNPDVPPLKLLWPLQTFDAGTGAIPLIPLALTSATLTAKISITSDGKLSLTGGRLSGVMSVSHAMQIPLAFGTCPTGDKQQGFFGTLSLFCSQADLPNTSDYCDALSVALGFETVPASFSTRRTAPATLCPDAGPLPGCPQPGK